MTITSRRAMAANGAFDAVKNFYLNSRYGERRTDPGDEAICSEPTPCADSQVAPEVLQ